MDTPLEAPAAPRGGWIAGHVKLIAGIVAVLILAPVIWVVGTMPIASGSKVVTGTGGAAKGVGPQVDYEAPNFKLLDPSGKPVELKQFRGHPVLLNFWATWCAPCREEMPEIEQIYREYKDRGLIVLGISVDDSSSTKNVPELIKEGSPSVGSYTFPVALDVKQEVLQRYKLLGVPSSYFIDASGVIRVVQPRAMSRQNIVDGVAAVMPKA
jgi:peroxiredoxin